MVAPITLESPMSFNPRDALIYATYPSPHCMRVSLRRVA